MSKRRAAGLFLIAVGIILLLNNYGVLAREVWHYIWRLWPLLLIFAGLQVLSRRQVLLWGLTLWLMLGILWYSVAAQQLLSI